MKPQRNLIEQAISDVRDTFPFPQLFEETEEKVRTIANLLQELDSGGRLLDIGCEALDKTTVLQRLGYECFACDDFQDPCGTDTQKIRSLFLPSLEKMVFK